jgi:lysozyme family protein
MLQATQIKWGQAHNLWNDFKLGDLYTQYLFDTYDITVEAGGRVIWNHVLNIIEVTISQGGAPLQDGVIGGKTKVARKKIKLIFIMGDVQITQTKEVKDIIAPQIVSDIQNKISEQLKTQISLSDVQIIKG